MRQLGGAKGVSLEKMQPLDFTFYRGRVGLFAILRALGIGAGDEVITQAFTCSAVPEGIIATGAKPVFADVERDGVNICCESVEEKINLSTKAIIVQHTFGIPADMNMLSEITQDRKIALIEDCCHTLDSRYDKKFVGSFGCAAFYSFEWGKPIVAGIGGAVIINAPFLLDRTRELHSAMKQPTLARTIRLQAQYGAFQILYRPSLYWPLKAAFQTLGRLGAVEGNYNAIDPLRPAADFSLLMSKSIERRLRRKLRTLARITAHSHYVAKQYSKLAMVGGHVRPIVSHHDSISFARFPLWCEDKKEILSAAQAANIEVSDWYATPVHPLDNYSLSDVHYTRGSCPHAERACQHVVSLPTHRRVTHKYVQRVLEFLESLRG